MVQEYSLTRRYVPLLVWLIALATLVLIPLKILQYGFTPGGDALRHVAKAFTDKADHEIVVLRPEHTIDHHPGWEWLLRALHKTVGWNADQLIAFSVISLFLCLLYAALPWLRWPEAWLAAWLAELVALPDFMVRLAQTRPLLITAGVLVAILFSWSKNDFKTPSPLKLILTSVGFFLSAWMHGVWYLWVFVLVAFFLARAWRAVFWLALCWLAGSLMAGIFTGSPFHFLAEGVWMASSVYHEHIPQWLLVGEFTPSEGEAGSLLLLAAVFLWRRQQGKTTGELLDTPIFWLIVIGWILGLRADRCWTDWGVPAVLVWLTLQFQDGFAKSCDAASPRRLLVCSLIALPLLFQSTNDLDRRYTHSLDDFYLDAKDPALQGWLPEKDGIFYCSRMDFYYNTFYKNPQAEWRYILGFEPALMPADDLKIFRAIQVSRGALQAYEPWIKKMRPADRLVIYGSSQPDLPELQWHYAGGSIWLGRLPR